MSVDTGIVTEGGDISPGQNSKPLAVLQTNGFDIPFWCQSRGASNDHAAWHSPSYLFRYAKQKVNVRLQPIRLILRS